jgi:PTS system ascorbate-specific IIC component
VVGSNLLGFTMVLFPALAQPTMKKITGTDEIGFGHFSTVGYWLSAQVGKLVGKDSKSTEEMEFPKSLLFMRDTSVAISLTMALLYLVVAVAAGPEYVQGELSGGQNYIIFALIKAITFAGGVFVILSGVRLILGEIVPAFKGIASKLVPNAKPALDCPVVYPYAPNAVIIGFLSSFVGGILGMLILIGLKAPVILPGVVPHFFCGATAGVFGNATGGRRGAVIGAIAQGLLITFLPVLLMPVLGDLGFANTTFSDADFGTVGIILGKILQLFQ